MSKAAIRVSEQAMADILVPFSEAREVTIEEAADKLLRIGWSRHKALAGYALAVAKAKRAEARASRPPKAVKVKAVKATAKAKAAKKRHSKKKVSQRPSKKPSQRASKKPSQRASALPKAVAARGSASASAADSPMLVVIPPSGAVPDVEALDRAMQEAEARLDLDDDFAPRSPSVPPAAPVAEEVPFDPFAEFGDVTEQEPKFDENE